MTINKVVGGCVKYKYTHIVREREKIFRFTTIWLVFWPGLKIEECNHINREKHISRPKIDKYLR